MSHAWKHKRSVQYSNGNECSVAYVVKKTWLEIDASVTSSVGFQTPLNTPLCAFILQLNKEIQNCHTAQPSWNYLLGPYSERQILLLLSSVFACLFCKPLCSFHCGECMLRHSISISTMGTAAPTEHTDHIWALRWISYTCPLSGLYLSSGDRLTLLSPPCPSSSPPASCSWTDWRLWMFYMLSLRLVGMK